MPKFLFFELQRQTKYAIFGSKMSSQVKTDPAIITGLKKHSWSQNLKSLAQKTKIWHNNVLSRFWNNSTCILPEICHFWVQNVKLGKNRPRHFNGLEKTQLEPKFEVSSSKDKNLAQLCIFQKVWKILLSYLQDICTFWNCILQVSISIFTKYFFNFMLSSNSLFFPLKLSCENKCVCTYEPFYMLKT